MEISFNVKQAEDADLILDTIHSFNYGIYRVKLDSQEIGQLNLFAFSMTPTTDKLGWHHLDTGKHTLRFECTGKSAESLGYCLAFETLTARIPVYHRSPDVDLRTLQKLGAD